MTTIVRDIFVFVTAAIFVAASLLIATGGRRARVQGRRARHRPLPGRARPRQTPTLRAAISPSPTRGKTADRLIGGASPAAGQIEVHEVVDVDGMAKTRPLANGIEIKPGKTVELKPGALRIVLLGLKEPFQLGQKIKGTLVFEKAGPVEIVYNVEENPGGRRQRCVAASTIRRCSIASLAGRASPEHQQASLIADGPWLRRWSVFPSYAGPTARARDGDAGLESSFSSGDFDQCPARTKCQRHRSRQPAAITAKKATQPGRSPPRLMCACASRGRTGILCPYHVARMGA